jgi:hypothetical protein
MQLVPRAQHTLEGTIYAGEPWTQMSKVAVEREQA